MISARRANPGLALILAAIAPSTLRSSARIVLAIAASALATTAGGRCSPCCLIRSSASFQGRPSRNQPVDLVACGIVRLGLAVGKRLGEPGDRVGVDRIVLGQPSGRFGEVANPFRVHDPDFDTGRAQRFRPAALVTAARLHHRPADPVRAHPRHQPGPAFRRARRRQAQSLRTNAGVDCADSDGSRHL
jgi:hypothetical protein